MKAVILETQKKYAAALFADGSVMRVKNKNYAIGQEVHLQKEQPVRFRRAAAMAASMTAGVVCDRAA